MTNYTTQLTFRTNIPPADITPLEKLILDQIFESDDEDGEIYFYQEEGGCDYLSVSKADLQAALLDQPDPASVAHQFIVAELAKLAATDDMLEIDLDENLSDEILKNIVARSTTLTYIEITAAFTCDKMRSDGFGGMAKLITATAAHCKSTYDIMDEFKTLEGIPI